MWASNKVFDHDQRFDFMFAETSKDVELGVDLEAYIFVFGKISMDQPLVVLMCKNAEDCFGSLGVVRSVKGKSGSRESNIALLRSLAELSNRLAHTKGYYFANVPDDLSLLASGIRGCSLLYTLPHNLPAT